MTQQFSTWCRRFWPQAIGASWRDRILGSLGAGLGLLLSEWLSRQILGAANPWFIAPMGASAVLLFAAPASPLAQPWSIIGGNLVAALIGVSCANWIPNPGLAASVAVALAIASMFALRCLHPPSGAVALTAVLGGPVIHQLGYRFVLCPVLLNSVLLTLMALLFNNLARRRYPHSPVPTVHAEPPPSERVGISRADLHAVLVEHGELLDISEDDLREVLQQAETRAHRRRFGELRCADFMRREVPTITPDTRCAQASTLLRRHGLSALPVVSAAGRLLGIVGWHELYRGDGTPVDGGEPVQGLLRTAIQAAGLNDAIEQLVRPLSDGGLQQMPVLDEAGRVVGMVSQADLIAALFHEHIKS